MIPSGFNVCDAAHKGDLKERAARGLTVSCTLYHSYARVGHESTELGNVLPKSTRNGCLVSLLACNELARLRFIRVN